MYCRQCGTQLPDDSKFCSNCGAAQAEKPSQKHEKKRSGGFFLGMAVCAILVLLIVLVSGGKEDEEPVMQQQTRPTSASTVPVETTAPTTAPETVPQTPENGWYEESGKRYYYSDGEAVTGLQEISNELYYFDMDGSMMVDTDVDYGGNTLEIGKDGKLTGVTFAVIDGEWSEEKYKYGNSGRCSIKVLDTEVSNCDQTGFYIEANGNRGAKVNGTWKLYVRSHGSWIFVKEVNFTEPSGTFTIKFDSPMDFDAITAHPTVQGNASYSSYIALVDVHMGL